jgi:hypothetical protein
MHGVNINLDPSCGNCGNCFTLDNWIADQEKRARAFRMSFDFEELETGSISCGGWLCRVPSRYNPAYS